MGTSDIGWKLSRGFYSIFRRLLGPAHDASLAVVSVDQVLQTALHIKKRLEEPDLGRDVDVQGLDHNPDCRHDLRRCGRRASRGCNTFRCCCRYCCDKVGVAAASCNRYRRLLEDCLQL